MQRLDALEEDLKSKTDHPAAIAGVPTLGPVWKGGRPILLQDCTHPTDGLERYPAFDDAFVAGREVIAPEALEVIKDSSSKPGDAFYAKGKSASGTGSVIS